MSPVSVPLCLLSIDPQRYIESRKFSERGLHHAASMRLPLMMRWDFMVIQLFGGGHLTLTYIINNAF